MTAAVRLYAAKGEADSRRPAGAAPKSVTPTEIVVTVSDLIRVRRPQSLGRVDVVQPNEDEDRCEEEHGKECAK